MSSNIITKEEIYEILKKRKQENDKDNIDGSSSIEDDNIDDLIINSETEKFFEIFEKAFSSEEEEQLDSEDGLVQDIFSGIISKIREKLKLFNKTQVLNFIFKFFVKQADTNNIDGKN